MVKHIDSSNTAEKLLSLSSICDQNVSIELQGKISRNVIKGIPKYLSEEEIIKCLLYSDCKICKENETF